MSSFQPLPSSVAKWCRAISPTWRFATEIVSYNEVLRLGLTRQQFRVVGEMQLVGELTIRRNGTKPIKWPYNIMQPASHIIADSFLYVLVLHPGLLPNSPWSWGYGTAVAESCHAPNADHPQGELPEVREGHCHCTLTGDHHQGDDGLTWRRVA